MPTFAVSPFWIIDNEKTIGLLLTFFPGPVKQTASREKSMKYTSSNDKEKLESDAPDTANESAIRKVPFVGGVPLTPIKRIPSVRGTVQQMLLSPDTKSIVALSAGNQFRRYDIHTWELLEEKTLRPSKPDDKWGDVQQIQFGTDGSLYGYIHNFYTKQLVRFSADGTVESFQKLECPSAISRMILSSDARMAFIVCDKNAGQLYINSSTSPVDFQFTNKRYDAMGPTFSPDGSWIALTDSHSVIHVINTKTQEITDFPMLKLNAWPIGWLPDGQTLIVGRKNEVVFLHLPDCEIIRTFSTKRGFARDARISYDERKMSFIFSSTRNENSWTLRVLDLETAQSLDDAQKPLPKVFDPESQWLPDGRLICVSTEWTILDESLDPVHVFDGIPGKWDTMAFLNDGTFAANDADRLRLFDSQTGQETARYSDLSLNCPHLFDDGQTLFEVLNDTALLYDLTKHKRIAKFPIWITDGHVTLSPMNDLLIGGDQSKNIVYSLPSGKKQFEFTCREGEHCHSVFSSDGKLILGTGGFETLVLIDTTTGQTLHSRRWSESSWHTLSGADFFPGDKQFYAVRNNTMTLFETATFRELYHKDFADPTDRFARPDVPTPRQADFTPDGQFFIDGVGFKSARFAIYDAKTLEKIREYHADKDYAKVIPDLLRQRIYFVTADARHIEIVQTTDLQKIVSFGPFDADIFTLLPFDDGKNFAVSFSSQGQVELFRADDLAPLGRVNLSDNPVIRMLFEAATVFSPDGRRFICKNQLNGFGSASAVIELYELAEQGDD